MFNSIRNLRGDAAKTAEEAPTDSPRGTKSRATGQVQRSVNLSAWSSPSDTSMRPRTALPVSSRQASSHRNAVIPNIKVTQLNGEIQSQVAEVNQLRSSLARLDEELARLPDLDGPAGGFAAGWKQQQLQAEHEEVVQKLAVVEPRLAMARARLMVLADPSLEGATTMPSGGELLASMQRRAQRLKDFISVARGSLDDDAEKRLKVRIKSNENRIAEALLSSGTPGAAGRTPQSDLETENARLHRELHALKQTQAELAAAQAQLNMLEQRLPVAALCAQADHVPATPRTHSSTLPDAIPQAHGPTLGELLVLEHQQQETVRSQRAQLLHFALPTGGAVMKRLKDRAARQHPTTHAQKLRARLNGAPKPMDGGRRRAFEALVRADVVKLAKTGKMEPRLAAREMHMAVADGTFGKGLLPQDRKLLLDVLHQMAAGGHAAPPAQSIEGVQESAATPGLVSTTLVSTTPAPAQEPAAQSTPANIPAQGTQWPDVEAALARWNGPDEAKRRILEVAKERIPRLDLKGLNLTSLPACIGNLHHVRTMVLSNNKELHHLPEELAGLQNLDNLEVKNCDLQGIPARLGEVKTLRSLDLSNNARLSSFPVRLGAFAALHTLRLAHCDLSNISGELFSSASKLDSLSLEGNKKLENLPDELTRAPKLRQLLLGDCNLKELPARLGAIPTLKTLDVSKNSRLSSLPEMNRGYSVLHELNLSSCNFSTLPVSLFSDALYDLDVSDNPKLGHLPEEIARCVFLRHLAAERCGLDRLPEALGNMDRLEEVVIAHNPGLKSLPVGLSPMKVDIFCRGTQLRLVDQLMARPIAIEERHQLEAQFDELRQRWSRVSLLLNSGSVEPARISRAKAEIDAHRMGHSGTLKAQSTTERGVQNWRRAETQISAWAKAGESLTTEKLKTLNKMLGDGMLPFNDAQAHVKFEAEYGEFRRRPTGFATPPHDSSVVDEREIAAEMMHFEDWLATQDKAVAAGQMQPEELAAQVFQRLVSIHPFPDANGRSARLAADFILQSHGLPPGVISHTQLILFSSGRNQVSPHAALSAMARGLEKTLQIYESHLELAKDSPRA